MQGKHDDQMIPKDTEQIRRPAEKRQCQHGTTLQTEG